MCEDVLVGEAAPAARDHLPVYKEYVTHTSAVLAQQSREQDSAEAVSHSPRAIIRTVSGV